MQFAPGVNQRGNDGPSLSGMPCISDSMDRIIILEAST
ncbi:hypothetical protein Goshw_021360 [Gossypium schwendimanii]|uniref:Uncharacterized protein n=1 Tax=Gossypium schwendimanii TaxID=34291 RepID=A0A7J9L4U6_GOSSC|nr:hypothetical protein [Gossypium schwendimanii]